MKRPSGLGRSLWFRYVLVRGLTDASDDVARIADICAGLKALERVEILRFHRMGKATYENLGIAYPLVET